MFCYQFDFSVIRLEWSVNPRPGVRKLRNSDGCGSKNRERRHGRTNWGTGLGWAGRVESYRRWSRDLQASQGLVVLYNLNFWRPILSASIFLQLTFHFWKSLIWKTKHPLLRPLQSLVSEVKGKHAISMSITKLWLGTGLAIGYLLVLREVNDFLSEGEFLFSLFFHI